MSISANIPRVLIYVKSSTSISYNKCVTLTYQQRAVSFTYKQSGVNYSLMDAFKNACLKASGSNPQVLDLGPFLLVDINEGLGSLNKLADDLENQTWQNYYYQVGWGNAATILNDLSATGATPLAMKMFIAVGNEKWFLNQKRWKNLIKGFADAAKYSKVSWNGGETQTLVDVVDEKLCVLGGSATGIINPKQHLLTDEKLRDGDRIILLESSGVHTNGITLIRKLFPDDPSTLTLAIKPKTLIYTPLINQLLKQKINLHFASHITGHGWRKIMRSKRNFSYTIETLTKPQKIFHLIQQKTGMSGQQMYGDYNMGAGFALYLSQKDVDKTLKIAKELNCNAIDAGFVETGPRILNIKPLGIKFTGKSLKIR